MTNLNKKLIPAATFCYVWLMVGFFTGTLVLIGPAGWLASGQRGVLRRPGIFLRSLSGSRTSGETQTGRLYRAGVAAASGGGADRTRGHQSRKGRRRGRGHPVHQHSDAAVGEHE